MYNRRIVCDIDDTISFTTSRNWKEATPNVPLIKKLNKLFDEGWEICYYTARGNLSCKTRAEAELKYKDGILEWFDKNNVKFTELNFNKPLASYYIDDKGITPDDFLKLEIEDISKGLSGAIVERRGNKVYKTAKNSLESAAWYKEASAYIPTIKVHSLIGETLCIDYIEKTDEPTVFQINSILETFKNTTDYVSFDTYIDRLNDHMNLYNPWYKDAYIYKLLDHKAFYEANKSFMHGDFSLDNMINNNGILYLIDPNKVPNVYSSWLLDLSKLLQSSNRFNNKFFYDYFYNQYSSISTDLLLLEISHWIRMRKYHSDKEYVDSNIELLIKKVYS